MAHNHSHKKVGPRKRTKKGERRKLLDQLRKLNIEVADPWHTPVWELRRLIYLAQGGHDG